MTPKVAGTGTSFKGAALYYLHDKRQAGEAERLTADRVAWSATRNLVTDDPEFAARIMAATAKNQDQLKAAAGVKNTGRQSAQHVYSYSLAWHPDEAGSLTQADMLAAADETLQALGATDHQAVIVAHNDTAHPHVHVIVNRVSPVDGRMLSTSNDRRILSAWALKHERERGQVYCIERERRAEGRPSPARDFAAANDRPQPPTQADKMQARAADLAKASEAMRERHSKEWAALSAGYKTRKNSIYAATGRAIGDAIEENKTRWKPAWREYFRSRADQVRAFERREKSMGGIIDNAMQAFSARKRAGIFDRRGVAATAFNFLTNKGVRLDVLTALHDKQRATLSGQQKAELDAAIVSLKDGRTIDLGTARSEFDANRAALIAKQAREKDEQRAAWRKLNEERRNAGIETGRYGAGRHQPARGAQNSPTEARRASGGVHARQGGEATQRATKPADSIPKRDWKKAVERTKETRTRNRGRSRKRTRDHEPD